jgi:hypothetical protein
VFRLRQPPKSRHPASWIIDRHIYLNVPHSANVKPSGTVNGQPLQGRYAGITTRSA